MKKRLTLAFIFLSFSVQSSPIQETSLPHLDLEMTAEEYESLLNHSPIARGRVSPALDMGKRFLEWLRFINQNRPEGKKISLSSQGTQQGYPITSPTFNNQALVMKAFNDLKASLPNFIKEIVFQNKPFISDLPISDQEFIKKGMEINRVYEKASRWSLQEPYLLLYAGRKKKDVRGYYFYSQVKDLNSVWLNWNRLPTSEKQKYKENLVNMCQNGPSSETRCKGYVEKANSGDDLKKLYASYLPASQATWREFFVLQNPRRDIRWTVPSATEVPFMQPKDKAVQDYVKNNIEEEWQSSSLNWRLRLFWTQNSSSPHIVFKPGVTPNVNGLGGSTITMDANQPITEYNVQWTIRHEFGHVLGFPDCYVEFYDQSQGMMVNYQIDTSDLMCSRKGSFKSRHLDELKRAYFKGRW